MAPAHGVLGLVCCLRELNDTIRPFVHRCDTMRSRDTPHHDEHVGSCGQLHRDSNESMETRASTCHARQMEAAMVPSCSQHCTMASRTPGHLSTALLQACGEVSKPCYFGHFVVILSQLPTVSNGRHGVGAWRSWACLLLTGAD